MYTREELEAEGLLDFRVFLCLVWEFLGLPRPTPVQLDYAHYLQHGPRRSVCEAFRGMGKSWIVVAFVLWLLLINPQKKIVVLSASQKLADDMSKFAKQIIEGMPLLQHLSPRMDQRDSSIAFDVGPATPSKDPSVKSAGITGQITGSRADVIIADDIEIPKNSYTHLLRERLSELVKELDAILKPDGIIRYLGTPQIEDTLYNKLAERGYEIRVWPAEVPKSPEMYRGRLAPFILRMIEKGAKAGTPVEPTRFPREDLDERLASYGRSGYALQYMLDTNPSDADKNPLKLKDCIVMDVDPDLGHLKLVWSGDKDCTIQDLPAGGLAFDRYQRPLWKHEQMVKYGRKVMAIDPSGKGTDETAYGIGYLLYGNVHLVSVGGFRDGYAEETLQLLAGKAARWQVQTVLCEENFGGGMFTNLLRPHLTRAFAAHRVNNPEGAFGCELNPEEWDGWSRGQKEQRILEIMEPLVQSHRLIVDRRVIEEDIRVQQDTPQYSFVQQFTRITRDKNSLAHEDRLEAVSMMCGYFVSSMDKDQDTQIAALAEDKKQEEIDRFMQNAFFPGAPFSHEKYDNWRDDMKQ